MSEEGKKDPVGEDIARVCHEVNRAYCQALGDESQKPWEEAPQWQRDSALAGVELHLGDPDAGPEASHESWMAMKVAAGWIYGPEKDENAKTHPCLVPFAELAREQQAKDFIFRAVVHAVAACSMVRLVVSDARIQQLEAEGKDWKALADGLEERILDLKDQIAQHVEEKQKLAEELKATAEANSLNRQNLRNTAASIVDLAAQIGRAIA